MSAVLLEEKGEFVEGGAFAVTGLASINKSEDEGGFIGGEADGAARIDLVIGGIGEDFTVPNQELVAGDGVPERVSEGADLGAVGGGEVKGRIRPGLGGIGVARGGGAAEHLDGIANAGVEVPGRAGVKGMEEIGVDGELEVLLLEELTDGLGAEARGGFRLRLGNHEGKAGLGEVHVEEVSDGWARGIADVANIAYARKELLIEGSARVSGAPVDKPGSDSEREQREKREHGSTGPRAGFGEGAARACAQ